MKKEPPLKLSADLVQTLVKGKKIKIQKLNPVRVMVETGSTTAKVMRTSKKPVKYSSLLWPFISEPFLHSFYALGLKKKKLVRVEKKGK